MAQKIDFKLTLFYTILLNIYFSEHLFSIENIYYIFCIIYPIKVVQVVYIHPIIHFFFFIMLHVNCSYRCSNIVSEMYSNFPSKFIFFFILFQLYFIRWLINRCQYSTSNSIRIRYQKISNYIHRCRLQYKLKALLVVNLFTQL